jgi:hypothetical protein
MNPEAYGYVLVASVAGGFTGALLMWSRKRSEVAGKSLVRGVSVLALGTVACACALFAFGRVFGNGSVIFAGTVTVVVTEWVAVWQSAMRLPVPGPLLQVGLWETAILRARWTGVRLFGRMLRNTPLRHLGGRVFLSEVGWEPQTVLRGIEAAEAVHLWALALSCPWLLFWGLQGWWTSVACGLAIHLPLNVFPVLHLRYVTSRMERYIAKSRRAGFITGPDQHRGGALRAERT